MKFENRQEQRFVCETMNSLLASLMFHLNDKTKEAVKIALRVLNGTEVKENERAKKEDEE